MSQDETTADSSRAWQRYFLVLGCGAVLGFVILALLGKGEILPFALASLGAAVWEATGTRVISQARRPVEWINTVYLIAGIIIGGGLAVAAIVMIAPPSGWAGSSSVVLGLVSGALLTDALLRSRPNARAAEQ